jgi:subtilase family serine protease
MKKIIKSIIFLFAMAMILMPAINAGIIPPQTEGDLIAIDIDRYFDGDICNCTIEVQNNDPNQTITTNFWVELRQDSQTGRYLGEVYVTEDLSPAQSFVTDPISFSWQEGAHTLWAKVDWRNNVHETDETNNWYHEWFSNQQNQ